MAKRISPEAIALTFFETAPVEAARMILNISIAKVKARERALTPAPVAKSKRGRKANAHADSPKESRQTSFPSSDAATA